MVTVTKAISEATAEFGYNPYTDVNLYRGIVPFSQATTGELQRTYQYNVLKATVHDVETFLNIYIPYAWKDKYIIGLYVEILRRYPNTAKQTDSVKRFFVTPTQFINYTDDEDLIKVYDNVLKQQYPEFVVYKQFVNGGTLQYSFMSDAHLLGAFFARAFEEAKNDALSLLDAIDIDALVYDNPVIDGIVRAIELRN